MQVPATVMLPLHHQGPRARPQNAYADSPDPWSQHCDAECSRYLWRMGVDTSQAPRSVDATLAIVACNGPLARGGPQLRCVETARILTAHGQPAVCLHGEGSGGARGCERIVDKLVAMPHFKAAIFLKSLPSIEQWKRVLQQHPCALMLLDLMDFSLKFHGYWCNQRHSIVRYLAGVIADNDAVWQQVSGECRAITAVRHVQYIEHFHSVTRRVSRGEAPPVQAVLLQEHRALFDVPSLTGRKNETFCPSIARALPFPRGFECHALWGSSANGGQNYREQFLARKLNLTRHFVHNVVTQHQGTGALFTNVFALYDLIVVWWPTVGTVQRLSNALATGVPVIAKASRTYIDTFGRGRGILFAEDVHELGKHARSLLNSPAFRLRTSDAGVAAASMFSSANISAGYKRFLKLSANAARNATYRRECGTRQDNRDTRYSSTIR